MKFSVPTLQPISELDADFPCGKDLLVYDPLRAVSGPMFIASKQRIDNVALWIVSFDGMTVINPTMFLPIEIESGK